MHWNCWSFSVTTEKKNYWTECIRNYCKKKKRQKLKRSYSNKNLQSASSTATSTVQHRGSTMLVAGDVIHGGRQYWSLLHEHVHDKLVSAPWSLYISRENTIKDNLSIQSKTIYDASVFRRCIFICCFIHSLYFYCSELVFWHFINLRKILCTRKKTNHDDINVIFAPPLKDYEYGKKKDALT